MKTLIYSVESFNGLVECLFVLYALPLNGWRYGQLPISKHFPIKLQLLLIRAVPLEYPLHRQLTIPRVGNWCSFISVCLSFIQLYFIVIVNLHQPIHEAQIYFVFLSVGNPKTVLKGGYSGWRGGSSFASLWLERLHVRACKCAYDCGVKIRMHS